MSDCVIQISSVADYVEKAQSADFETAIHYASEYFSNSIFIICLMNLE